MTEILLMRNLVAKAVFLKLINDLKKTLLALIDGKRKHVLQKQTTTTKEFIFERLSYLGFSNLMGWKLGHCIQISC